MVSAGVIVCTHITIGVRYLPIANTKARIPTRPEHALPAAALIRYPLLAHLDLFFRFVIAASFGQYLVGFGDRHALPGYAIATDALSMVTIHAFALAQGSQHGIELMPKGQ